MYKSVITAVLFILVLLPATAPRRSQAQSPQSIDVKVKNFPETQEIKGDVRVTNFPDLQAVRGSVSVEELTKYVKHEGIIVHTSRRGELAEMVYAGTVETEGYTSVLISMQGEIRSNAFSSGSIGVLLIPDEKPILRTLREAKRLQFPLECTVHTKGGDPVYFESEQVRKRIAFPRYHLYLYNTSNKSADANVYLYLSN